MPNSTTTEILVAGFGGQGILLMGQVLANAGLLDGLQVSWLPSYGPEMRGGSANCTVVLSTKTVLSPVVAMPGTVIAMNGPALERFSPAVKCGGLTVINSSLVTKSVSRQDMRVAWVPATSIAEELGSASFANMVMLGAYLEVEHVVSLDSTLESLNIVFAKRDQELIPRNREAIEKGVLFMRMNPRYTRDLSGQEGKSAKGGSEPRTLQRM